MNQTAAEQEKRKALRFEKWRESLVKAMRQDVAKLRQILRKKATTK